MLPTECKRRIIELVSDSNGRSAGLLSDHLGYLKATVRRDPRKLEDRGFIERSRDGAVPVISVRREQTYGQKGVQNLEGRRVVADRMVKEPIEGQVVFFDTGMATMGVARKAPKDGATFGVINSPRLAIELNEEDNKVKLMGGTLRRRAKALIGPTVESFTERTNFGLLSPGTNALDVESGLTTLNEDEARMKGPMVEKVAKVVLVADLSRLGRQGLVQFTSFGEIDLSITDRTLDADLREEIKNAGVIVADGVAR